MLVADNIVVLHLQKCGGSSIRWGIIKGGYTFRYSCEHNPINHIPNRYKKLPRIGFIRNPILWYRSVYGYTKNKKISRTPLYSLLSHGYTFDEFVKNATNLPSFFANNENLELYKKRLMLSIMNTYTCWTINEYEDVSELNSSYFRKTLLDHSYNIVGLQTAKVFRLEDGIEQILPYFPKMKLLRQNVTKNKIPIEKISNETKELIYQKDNQYFKKFNYSIV